MDIFDTLLADQNPDVPRFLRTLARALKDDVAETHNYPAAQRTFFMLALSSFYDPLADGMDRNTGNVLFRLSDQLTPEERAKIDVYPGDNETWLTLEDWRVEWTKRHVRIPETDLVKTPAE